MTRPYLHMAIGKVTNLSLSLSKLAAGLVIVTHSHLALSAVVTALPFTSSPVRTAIVFADRSMVSNGGQIQLVWNSSSGQDGYDPTTDPYSVVNQARRIDEQNRLQQQQARQQSLDLSRETRLQELRQKRDQLYKELRSSGSVKDPKRDFDTKFAITSELNSINREIDALSR